MFMLRFFEAPKQGTPTVIVELDSNMLIIMAKSLPDNMCRQALINGKLVCKGKDLLTQCEVWSKKTLHSKCNKRVPG